MLYRLAPEHPFPAAVDDSVAVYRELLKTYKPQHIGIYGASAGGILTGEVAVKIKQLGLPMPGALGIFTGTGDFSRLGDTQATYSVTGLAGHLTPPAEGVQWLADYVGSTDPKVVSGVISWIGIMIVGVLVYRLTFGRSRLSSVGMAPDSAVNITTR